MSSTVSSLFLSQLERVHISRQVSQEDAVTARLQPSQQISTLRATPPEL